MNNKGFTLIELLATVVILAIIVGISIVGVNANIRKSKEQAEEVFIETIKDAMDMYLDTDAKTLTFTGTCSRKISKSTGNANVVYKDVKISDIIGSETSPLVASDLVNPNNEGVTCKTGATVRIYRDKDYVYYYKMAKSTANFGCLKLDLTGSITNLPGGYSC